MNKQDYDKLSAKQRWVFDTQSMMLALMLTKEMGKNKFLRLIKMTSDTGSRPLLAFQEVYGYQTFQEINSKFADYIRDLSGDVAGARAGRQTPDSYLFID